MKIYLPLAALLLSGGAALALTSQELADQMTAAGYTRVEVKTGPTQIKVEAIRGTEKVETIYDAATGAVLSREFELVDAGDDTRPGVEIRDRDEDFTDGDESSDDDGSDDDNVGSDDDDDDSDDSDDDHGGDDNGHSHGGDDNDDDRDDDHGDDRDDDSDDNRGHGSDND